MAYQSKTYSLSDEVIAAIDAAKAKGESPNKFLLRVLGLNRPRITKLPEVDLTGVRRGRGKVTRETRRGKR